VHFISPLRIIMFLTVVWNHAESFARVRTTDDRFTAVLFDLSPEGRFVFVFITAFLIARSASTSSAIGRLVAIVGPLLVWCALYTGVEMIANGPGPGGIGSVLSSFLTVLVETPLYFVIVTIQLTLLTPLIQVIVRLARRAQIVLLTVAATAQIAVVALDLALATVRFPFGALCIWYPLWIIGGAVLAANLEAATRWFRANLLRMLAVLGMFAAAYVGIATSVDDPGAFGSNLLLRELRSAWNVLVGTALVATCMRLVASNGRWSTRAKRAGERMQDLGYGLFLAHELVLHGLATALAPVSGTVPFPVLTLILWAGAAAATLGFVLVARRTPLSWSLTGRPMQRRVVRAPVHETA
jgi:hypothetical protein